MTTPKRSRLSLSILELVALCIFVAALTVIAHREILRPHFYFSAEGMRELEALHLFDAPTRASRNHEEPIARDFFRDKRGGVFLDVGANHYHNGNNTYFLEKTLGWSGVAVDALAEFAEGYQQHRPRTRFAAMFASDVTDARVRFFVPAENNMGASGMVERHPTDRGTREVREVPTTTLTAVLDEAGITKLDYLSMDIELAEPKALAGFDIDRFKPELVCIEGHPEVRQEILDYFHAHDYVLVGKYLRLDPQNLYFMPAGRRDQ